MKITKDEGEQPSPSLPRRITAELRPVLAVSGAGSTLWAGSRILISRGWALLGRHFTGWEKAGVVLGGGYLISYAARQAPEIAQFAAPGLAVAWCVAAWCTAPTAPRTGETSGPGPDEPEEHDLALDDLAAAVRRIAGPRQGAHLAQLLDDPEFTGWEQADLKAAILALDVPVEEFKLTLAGRQRVRDGVRVRHLPADATPEAPASAPPGAPAEPAPRPAAAPPPHPEQDR
ncbi:hypothetical protein ABZX85_41715 [Streptomyces sp. NPDC004539]|uniref:hypothetical protein n=1 Tax=Streptomyces sp. NPDC004539 TaxID=3154280 RepID=UPI0033B77BF7